MIDSVSRIFVKFKTRSGRSVYWGMWFTKSEAIDFATKELKHPENQTDEDPFVGYELVYTNVLYTTIGYELVLPNVLYTTIGKTYEE